MKKTEFQKN